MVKRYEKKKKRRKKKRCHMSEKTGGGKTVSRAGLGQKKGLSEWKGKRSKTSVRGKKRTTRMLLGNRPPSVSRDKTPLLR